MFGRKNKEASTNNSSSSSRSSASTSSGHNILVKDTHVEGTIRSQSDLRIDGHFTGNLFCDAKLIIGADGIVDGQIECRNAIVEGRFNGNLQVDEVLHVKEGANIQGDVITGKLLVQSGSIFDVTCKMTNHTPITEDELEEVEGE